ncbi:MAG: tetratricopeptide repeat protein [Terracidiphilus sp.]
MRRALLLGTILALGAGALGQTASAPDRQRQAALAMERQGKTAQAEAAWRAVMKAHPNSPEPYAHLGLLEARHERFKEAVPLYRKALALGPDIPGLRMNLGLALFKSGSLKEAIQEFGDLLKKAPVDSPDHQRLTILIGMAHYGLAEYPEAIPYLKEAADRDAQSLPLRLALAHSYIWSKQFEKVMDVYREILALNGDSAEADMLVGEALNELKDTTAAVQQFRAAVTANPKAPNAHFGLGYLLWSLKRYPEAQSEFAAELANDPDHILAMVYLGDTDIQLNKMDLARPLLDRAVKMDPSQGMAFLDLGIMDSEAGRNEDALRELKAAERLTPDDVNVHWRLGRLYRTMGNKEEAKAELDKASALNKAAQKDLHDKIANAHARPPQEQTEEAPAAKPAGPRVP